MTIDYELIGIGLTFLSPIYYFLYKMSVDLTKVTTTIELCPNCPHSNERDDEN